MSDEEFMQMVWDSMADPYTGVEQDWVQAVHSAREVDRRNHRIELLDELIAEADARLEVEMRSWGGYAEGTDCDGWSFMSSVLADARNKERKG